MVSTLRTIFSFALGLAVAWAAHAQPVVNAPTYGSPVVGARFTITNLQISSLPRVDSGANRAWSFAFPRSSSGATQGEIVPLSQGIITDSFPQASSNIRLTGNSGNVLEFYAGNEPGGFTFYGFSGNQAVNRYEPFLMLLPYGLGLGDTVDYTTTNRFSSGVSNTAMRFSYYGYGSLDINGTQYPEVVCIKRYDRPTAGSTGAGYTYHVFFAPNVGYPVAIFTVSPSGFFNGEYMSSLITAAAPSLAQSFSTYPNPTQDQLTLHLPSELVGSSHMARLLDATGRLAATLPVTAQGQTSLEAVAPGAYQLVVQGEGQAYRARVLKAGR